MNIGCPLSHKLRKISWLVVSRFNATLTAKVISLGSETHICFLAFSHKFLSKATKYFSHMLQQSERQKYTRRKFCLNRVLNSQPPGHESNTLTTEPAVLGQTKKGKLVLVLPENQSCEIMSLQIVN